LCKVVTNGRRKSQSKASVIAEKEGNVAHASREMAPLDLLLVANVPLVYKVVIVR
jgi:hypothetical protein